MKEPEGNYGLIKLNFLVNPEKELQIHAQIAQKNLNVMQQHEAAVSNAIMSLLDSLASQRKIYNKCVDLKCQNALSKLAYHEKFVQLTSLSKNIRNKENTIKILEQNLKRRTEEHEKLKAIKAKEDQDDRAAVKAFKKGMKFFRKYFQYDIKMKHLSEDAYCIMITFRFEGEESKYPIEFVLDKQTDSVLSCDAGALMSTEQQALLFKRYKETNNDCALLCTLRNIALKKHVT